MKLILGGVVLTVIFSAIVIHFDNKHRKAWRDSKEWVSPSVYVIRDKASGVVCYQSLNTDRLECVKETK